MSYLKAALVGVVLALSACGDDEPEEDVILDIRELPDGGVEVIGETRIRR